MSIVDKRELRIILQNSMAHATNISMHNSKGKKIEVDEVFDMAKKIALKVATLGLNQSKEEGEAVNG